MTDATMANRLLMVSNRLPITISRNSDEFHIVPSSGGLVSGISGLAKSCHFQ